jgi:hydroxymethylbilane synthase
VTAERAVSRKLGGSCEVPLAAHAQWNNSNQLVMHSYVASVDGQQICLASGARSIKDHHEAEAFGLAIADDLLAQGAAALLPH